MRIGLYGGCFNPVHTGHLAAARGAIEALGLDRLVLIPSGQPPLKGGAGLVSGLHRAAMLEQAIADETGMEVSTVELDRTGPSFTLDSVRALRKTFPANAELFFLLGDDCVARLPQWKGIDELHDMLRFAILPRAGGPSGSDDERLIWLKLPPVRASSTQIREILQSGARAPSSLLPLAVANYIDRHSLYSNPAERAYA